MISLDLFRGFLSQKAGIGQTHLTPEGAGVEGLSAGATPVQQYAMFPHVEELPN
jgi:hypothetical protein